MMNSSFKPSNFYFAVLSGLALAVSCSAFSAESVPTCGLPSGTDVSKNDAAGSYALAVNLVADGLPNLAYFTLDRAIRTGAVSASTFAALDCLENLQTKNAILDLPNYDERLPALIAGAKKSPSAQAVLARFAFRSVVQKIVAGNTKDSAFKILQPALKISALGNQAATGLIASADGQHQKAIMALRAALASPAIGDLKIYEPSLRLALARSLYASGNDAAAITEYEKLYHIGLPMQDALIESAWAQLRATNYVKSIGLSFELTTGKLSQFFAPEALSIRSISFLENCRYSESRKVIDQFGAVYNPIAEWLKTEAKSSQSLYETAIARSEGALGKDAIPEKVWSMWSGSDLFNSTQNGITKAFAESRNASGVIEEEKYAKARKSLTSDLKLIEAARKRAAERIESHLEKMNDSMLARIARENERLRFVRIEASQGAGRDIIYRNANPELADMEKRRIKADRAAKSYKGKLDWGKVEAENPETETWLDEIGNFEAKSLDRCKAKEEYKKSKTG